MNSSLTSSLAPLRSSTAGTVRARILRSPRNVTSSTYSSSRAIICARVRRLRPLIATSAVMPGRSARMRSKRERYFSTMKTRLGRGPTRLMSPRITLKSCGSSSRLVERIHLPHGVMRGSFSSK